MPPSPSSSCRRYLPASKRVGAIRSVRSSLSSGGFAIPLNRPLRQPLFFGHGQGVQCRRRSRQAIIAPMLGEASQIYEQTLCELRDAGLEKIERELESAQGVEIRIGGRTVLNFCNNNYLGLAAHPEVRAAAHAALDRWGFGLAAGRLLSGTQTQHRALERRLAGFVGSEDAILFSSCFDANGGLFEALLGPDDAVLSDALNHASIIDGIRLCKAERLRYEHDDLADLEAKLQAAAGKRLRLIATDGVFSMDGDIARLDAICDLAERHGALVMVDDSHATA